MENSSVTDNVKRAMAKAILDEILQMIDSAEGNAFTFEDLAAHIDQLTADAPKEKPTKILDDGAIEKDTKERFWTFGSISCSNGTLLLRKPIDSDRGGFLRLQQEYSPLSSLLKDDRYCESVWNEHIDSTELMLSITKAGVYIGYCGIKDLSKKPLEIAIELLPEWTHHGIGRAALSAMLTAVQERLGIHDFRVRIDPANIASQGFFEKLGAKPNGISTLILRSDDEIRQCEEANLHLIDDSLIAVAEKFHTEPRKLLSHVLEYSLHWS